MVHIKNCLSSLMGNAILGIVAGADARQYCCLCLQLVSEFYFTFTLKRCRDFGMYISIPEGKGASAIVTEGK